MTQAFYIMILILTISGTSLTDRNTNTYTHKPTLCIETGMIISFECVIDDCQSYWALHITPRFHHCFHFLYNSVCMCVRAHVYVLFYSEEFSCALTCVCVFRMKMKDNVLSLRRGSLGDFLRTDVMMMTHCFQEIQNIMPLNPGMTIFCWTTSIPCSTEQMISVLHIYIFTIYIT